MSNKYYIDLQPNNIYHVFSRAIGDEKLFKSEENYFYFISKMKQHLHEVIDILAYSFLPNHFHLLVKIKNIETIKSYYTVIKKKPINEITFNCSDFIMERFSNWLNGYTKAFNKMYSRKGSLFMDYLRRSIAQTDEDISAFIFYIHKNAVHHNYVKNIGDWKFDSYNTIISDKPTSLLREDVLKWFYDKKGFIEFHKQNVYRKLKTFEDF